MRIVSLEADNFKRLKAVEIVPAGDVIEVVGRNGAGKSSVLDAIWAVLGGAEANPEKPIRIGETSASATVDLGDLVVTRKWTEKGSTIVVANPDGSRHRTPQAMLDDLMSKITFDPFAFVRMTAAKQVETLRRLVELDTSDLDESEADYREQRTIKGREAKQLRGHADSLPFDKDAPAAEVSTEELAGRLAEIEKQRTTYEAKIATVVAENATCEQAIAQAHEKIKELQAYIAKQRKAVDDASDLNEQRKVWLAENRPPDPGAAKTALADARTANERVRRNANKAAATELAKREEAAYAALTEQIEKIQGERQARIKAAKFPLAGLTLGDGQVLLNAVPAQQLSSAEQIELGLAIGIASNPKLRVVRIQDGSLLDDDTMATLRAWAARNDCQVWIERVGGPNSPTGVVIEDGEVLADRQVPASTDNFREAERV